MLLLDGVRRSFHVRVSPLARLACAGFAAHIAVLPLNIRSLGYRTLKSMPAYERLQVKQDIESKVAALKQQKREQGLTDKEFLQLKSLQGDLAGVTYWANPTRKKNRLERMEREHNATLRRRTISARAIERELHIAEDIAETQRRTAANLAA